MFCSAERGRQKRFLCTKDSDVQKVPFRGATMTDGDNLIAKSSFSSKKTYKISSTVLVSTGPVHTKERVRTGIEVDEGRTVV